MFFPKSTPRRPGRVKQLLGVIFQSDGASGIGAWFIRPMETLDRRLAGADRSAPSDFPDLAMHAGLHVLLEDGREMVAEQLIGTLRNNFQDGLNWTPIDQFRSRDRSGWDATVPATAFRGVTEDDLDRIVARLNTIDGYPFLREDCAGFIERVVERRLFADSPLLRRFGIGVRVGDPALPLLRPDVSLDHRTAELVRADVASQLPDPLSDVDDPTVHSWRRRLAVFCASGIVAVFLVRRFKHAGNFSSAATLP
jgi:hypothetical protein